MVPQQTSTGSETPPPAPFIVGVVRSGTTLLRLMLDSHPELTIPPETHFVPGLIRTCEERSLSAKALTEVMIEHRRWADFGISERRLRWHLRRIDRGNPTEVLRAFYRLYARSQGKPRWGDKTPGYQLRMIRISKALPEARFIHVIRDGRDVTVSRMRKSIEQPRTKQLAKDWRRRIRKTRRWGQKLDHYLEIRYEDLVLDTEPTLRRVCEFIELPWDPAMLAYHEQAGERLQEIAKELPRRDEDAPPLDPEERIAAHALTREPPRRERVEAWRTEMDAQMIEKFESVAADTLEELGYEVVGTQGPEEASPASETAPAGGEVR